MLVVGLGGRWYANFLLMFHQSVFNACIGDLSMNGIITVGGTILKCIGF